MTGRTPSDLAPVEGLLLVAARAVPSLAIRWDKVPASIGMSEWKVRQLEDRGLIRPFTLDGVKLVATQDLLDLVEEGKRRGHLDSLDYAQELREAEAARLEEAS